MLFKENKNWNGCVCKRDSLGQQDLPDNVMYTKSLLKARHDARIGIHSGTNDKNVNIYQCAKGNKAMF